MLKIFIYALYKETKAVQRFIKISMEIKFLKIILNLLILAINVVGKRAGNYGLCHTKLLNKNIWTCLAE
jgi:hypothetical protein